MKDQIEFDFSGDKKACPRRRTRRAQWARLWFTRMHEVVEEAEDYVPMDDRHQSRTLVSSHDAFQKN